MSFASLNKLTEKTTVGKCLEREGIRKGIGREDNLKENLTPKNLIEVSVARRVPGIYVVLSLARPVKIWYKYGTIVKIWYNCTKTCKTCTNMVQLSSPDHDHDQDQDQYNFPLY